MLAAPSSRRAPSSAAAAAAAAVRRCSAAARCSFAASAVLPWWTRVACTLVQVMKCGRAGPFVWAMTTYGCDRSACSDASSTVQSHLPPQHANDMLEAARASAQGAWFHRSARHAGLHALSSHARQLPLTRGQSARMARRRGAPRVAARAAPGRQAVRGRLQRVLEALDVVQRGRQRGLLRPVRGALARDAALQHRRARAHLQPAAVRVGPIRVGAVR